jgi:hypothetical protein
MVLEELIHLFPILLRLQGTGGVHQEPSRSYDLRCSVEQLALKPDQTVQVLRSHFPASIGMAAESPCPQARDVQQNALH